MYKFYQSRPSYLPNHKKQIKHNPQQALAEATYSYSICPYICNSLPGTSKTPHAILGKNYFQEETEEGHKSVTILL